MQNINLLVSKINNFVWGWPTIIGFIFVGIFATIRLNFVQVRYFIESWKIALKKQDTTTSGEMNPLQAFLSALSTSIGNGSLAGMATAIHSGGPGAAFWIFVIGFFALSIRYCEVYLSNYFKNTGQTITSGGPMSYLKHVPGGAFLPAIYAFFCLLMAFMTGNAMQANSISNGLQKIVASVFNQQVNYFVVLSIAFMIFCFVLYVVLGGSERIIKISEKIIPVKVGVFFVSALVLLLYHYKTIVPALVLITKSAFLPSALKGALMGITVQSAIKYGISRSINASEIGLGTAAVFFGSSSSSNNTKTAIMSMVSAFISNYLVCFVICLAIVASGVWNESSTGILLTTSAFATLYGKFAPWLITFLSVIFGIGVLVPYAFIGKECWSYLSKNRLLPLFMILYPTFSFLGAILNVDLVWTIIDIINAFLLAINLYAIVWLLPKIKAKL